VREGRPCIAEGLKAQRPSIVPAHAAGAAGSASRQRRWRGQGCRRKQARRALVDVPLPDRDRITLAGELTALPWRPRVVLTSVDPDAAGPDDVRRSGAHAFLSKDQLANGTLPRLLGFD
jgi:DNA-binding NarL/FixJ family response regulator